MRVSVGENLVVSARTRELAGSERWAGEKLEGAHQVSARGLLAPGRCPGHHLFGDFTGIPPARRACASSMQLPCRAAIRSLTRRGASRSVFGATSAEARHGHTP